MTVLTDIPSVCLHFQDSCCFESLCASCTHFPTAQKSSCRLLNMFMVVNSHQLLSEQASNNALIVITGNLPSKIGENPDVQNAAPCWILSCWLTSLPAFVADAPVTCCCMLIAFFIYDVTIFVCLYYRRSGWPSCTVAKYSDFANALMNDTYRKFEVKDNAFIIDVLIFLMENLFVNIQVSEISEIIVIALLFLFPLSSPPHFFFFLLIVSFLFFLSSSFLFSRFFTLMWNQRVWVFLVLT